jgi:hypothetical protein
MTKEALNLALEALETNNKAWRHLADSGDAGFWEAEEQPFYELSVKAITAIKEALAQPERLREENERLHVENRRLIDRIETIGVPVGVGGFATITMAQPEQELCTRVECMGSNGCIGNCWNKKLLQQELVCVCGAVWEGQELVETPPQRTWVGLKDKEIEEIWKVAMFTDYGIGAELSNQPFVHYAKAIEAKLRSKNHEI